MYDNFWILRTKVSILRRNLESKFQIFITLVWLDFFKEMWFRKSSKLICKVKRQAMSISFRASEASEPSVVCLSYANQPMYTKQAK